MRLIDADALPDALFQKHVHYGEGTEMYLSYDDVVDAIDAAPAVDAIPVEWLAQRSFEASYNGAKPNIDLNYAFCTVINEWQKEQEAANG